MEQPQAIPEYHASRRTPKPEAGVYAKKAAQGRNAAHGGDRVADLLATLALPVLVLVLVVNRLSLGIVGRRHRDKHH